MTELSPSRQLDEDEESSICTLCGLCCNGAIFDYAPLGDDETGLIATLGLRPVASAQGFAQACSRLEGTVCGVYAARPAVCKAYRCEVLINHQAGTLVRHKALELIQRAVALATQATTGSDCTLAEQRKALHTQPDSWKAGDPAGLPERARRHVALVALQRLLDNHFRRPKQKQLAILGGASDASAEAMPPPDARSDPPPRRAACSANLLSPRSGCDRPAASRSV